MKLVTILFLRKDAQILLAMKKRGFGEGKWNGVGGKVDAGEQIAAAAIRECREEIGVTPIDPKLVGRLKFYEKTDPTFGHDAHIYITRQWEGDPIETEEMRPQWFAANDIPYQNMWADDKFWLPHLLKDQLFEGTFTLDGNKIASHDIKTVASLTEAT